MNVAFVNRMLGMIRGGGEMWDLQIATGLEQLGIDVTFYLGEPLLKDLSHPVENAEYVAVPTPHLRHMAYAAPVGVGGVLEEIDSAAFNRRAADRVRRGDHDLVHVNSDPRFAKHAPALDAPLTIKMNGPPHSLWHDYLHPFSSSYDLLSAFDAIIATGTASDTIRERADLPVTTINPGVDTDLFVPDGSSGGGPPPTLLFVGRFVPAKNLSLLLEAFASLLTSVPEAELVLVGDGPLERTVGRKIRRLNIEASVSLEGYVENSVLPEYYRRSDVFVLTSRRENHPITLLEAMSCGTPVVAPRIGAIPDIVDEGENGVLYELGDREALTRVLLDLVRDPERLSRLGANGRQKAVGEFGWDRQAERLGRCFRRLTDRTDRGVNS